MPESAQNDQQQARRGSANLLTSLPFLFTVGVVLFALSFLISSFPFSLVSNTEREVQKVYFADNIGISHLEIIERFNRLHEGKIEVIPIDLPFSKFNTNQRKDLIARNLRSSGSRIDVFAVDLIWVKRFVKWAEPLTTYFPQQYLEGLLPEATSACYVDGTLYAMPLYLDIGVLYYRQDLIRGLPDGQSIEARIQNSITWNELIEIGQRHFPGNTYLFQGEAYEGLICNFNEILGQPLYDRNSGEMIPLTEQRMVDRLEFMAGLIHKNQISPFAVTRMTEDECLQYSLDNDVPFVRGWPTLNNEVEGRFNRERFRNLAVAPLPHFEGEDPTPVFGGWNMMLSKHSPVKDAAIEFIEFAASEAGQRVFYESGSLLPIQVSFYSEDTSDPLQERIQTLSGMMSTGLHRPAMEEYTLISDILATQIHRALLGESTAIEALEIAEAQIRNLDVQGVR